MKKITLNAPAKINLTLDILGVTKGFHDIKSLVTSIDLYDIITVKKRKDGKITLVCEGLPVDCAPADN
ncbi:MAG: 4-(cytidine 5'-diphospho)-2-C-methyl-D-erythritol kinase, partial [Clostridia bacterium]|nr:4-(cytidine 5'-diphospho)-2-C-methyl-D-erythritol kinase [Clostridia bacterium]